MSRPQSRVNAERSGPGKTKGAGGARKRASGSRSSGTDDDPTEKRGLLHYLAVCCICVFACCVLRVLITLGYICHVGPT